MSTYPSDQPATERDALETAPAGTYSLTEIYAHVQAAGAELTARENGNDIIHGQTDRRWKRRVRNTLQTLKRQGRARRAGPSVWILDGRPAAPRAAVLVSLTGAHGQVELRLADAALALSTLDEPADLILTDPPYGLGVGTDQDSTLRTYQRDQSKVVTGYVDVPPAQYRDFTATWVAAAAAALRPGGHLAVVTGPQQAAWVQIACEDAGLTWVNQLAVGRVFPLRTTRRFAAAHWAVTICCRGPIHSTRRVFHPPPDLPKARSGVDYPLDLWPTGDVGRSTTRRGELRYPNSLPVKLADRLIGAFTTAPEEPDDALSRDLVVDPFVGGGTICLAAARRGLRFIGFDLNVNALAFTMSRVSRSLLDVNQPEVAR